MSKSNTFINSVFEIIRCFIDLNSLANALLYFQNHYQDEDFEINQEFQHIEIQIEQYQILSQQAKYGKV